MMSRNDDLHDDFTEVNRSEDHPMEPQSDDTLRYSFSKDVKPSLYFGWIKERKKSWKMKHWECFSPWLLHVCACVRLRARARVWMSNFSALININWGYETDHSHNTSKKQPFKYKNTICKKKFRNFNSQGSQQHARHYSFVTLFNITNFSSKDFLDQYVVTYKYIFTLVNQ